MPRLLMMRRQPVPKRGLSPSPRTERSGSTSSISMPRACRSPHSRWLRSSSVVQDRSPRPGWRWRAVSSGRGTCRVLCVLSTSYQGRSVGRFVRRPCDDAFSRCSRWVEPATPAGSFPICGNSSRAGVLHSGTKHRSTGGRRLEPGGVHTLRPAAHCVSSDARPRGRCALRWHGTRRARRLANGASRRFSNDCTVVMAPRSRRCWSRASSSPWEGPYVSFDGVRLQAPRFLPGSGTS